MAKKKDLLAIFSDKPARKDLLNFKDYSNLLANVITNSETPSTIGIFGEWGSGKTSLMLMIEELLQKKGIKTIWFNAWKYDKEEALWRALILSIVRGLNAGQREIDETTLKLYEAVSTEKLGQVQIDWLEIGKTLLKGAAFLVAPLFLIPGIANAFANASFLDQVSSAFTRRKIQQSRERISSIEQFEEYYKILVSKHVSGDERIVILIDDLDRCIPVRSLEVLEALKSFLDATGCVYVVACDTRLINQGLSEKYDDKNGIHVDEYLAKIVQFSFAIPPIRVEDAEKFIKNFGLGVDSLEIRRLIATTIERNPRKLKRFLSDLKIKLQLVQSRGLLLKPDALVKMSCIANTWKEFWFATLKTPSAFSRAQKIALASAEGSEKTPEEIILFQTLNIDEQLNILLSSQPLVSDADLQEYIFLSTTTSANMPDKENKTRKQKESSQRPFSSSGILSDAPVRQDVFVGRAVVIEQILRAVSKDTSLILLRGQPGTGKTTLLRMLERIDSNNALMIYINLQGFLGYVGSEQNWYYELARQIVQRVGEKGYTVKFKPASDRLSLHEFEKLLGSISTSIGSRRLVLMMDEYEVLETSINKERLDRDFLGGLRYLLQSNPQLAIILSGRYRIESLSSSLWSPLLNMVGLNIELDRLSDLELSELARIILPARFGQSVVNYLIKKSEGLPLAFKLMLTALSQIDIQVPPDKIIEVNDIQKELDAIFNSSSDILYSALFSNPDIQLARRIANSMMRRNKEVLSFDELHDALLEYDAKIDVQQTLNRLISERMLLREIGDGNYSFAHQSLLSWLTQRSE